MSAVTQDRGDSLLLAFVLTILLSPVGLAWTVWMFVRNRRGPAATQWLLMLLFAIVWTVAVISFGGWLHT